MKDQTPGERIVFAWVEDLGAIRDVHTEEELADLARRIDEAIAAQDGIRAVVNVSESHKQLEAAAAALRAALASVHPVHTAACNLDSRDNPDRCTCWVEQKKAALTADAGKEVLEWCERALQTLKDFAGYTAALGAKKATDALHGVIDSYPLTKGGDK